MHSSAQPLSGYGVLCMELNFSEDLSHLVCSAVSKELRCSYLTKLPISYMLPNMTQAGQSKYSSLMAAMIIMRGIHGQNRPTWKFAGAS